MKRLRKKSVSVAGMDMNVLKPRMTDHLRVSKPSLFRGPQSERESNGEAEFVEDGSVVMRSGTVQHSKNRPMFGTSFGLEKTDYLSDLGSSETSSLPKRPSKDTNLFYKKAMRNSSELAESRRIPTACFGLSREQQTESYATQVVDSYPKVEDCGAQATQQTKRKLNPFVDKCEASATQKTAPKGVMPSKRMRGLTLDKPLSLEQFVALIMSPLAQLLKHNYSANIM